MRRSRGEITGTSAGTLPHALRQKQLVSRQDIRMNNFRLPGAVVCALAVALAVSPLPGAGVGAKGAAPLREEPSMQVLSKGVLAVIDESVFEVVTPKPVKDSLSYERPLPLDLIPFAIRNDRYYSIGTAFAISETEFLSAAHLFDIGGESLYTEYYIRDRKGNVCAVDDIVKFSDNQDFIVFTAKGLTAKKTLPVSKSFALNEQVRITSLGEPVEKSRHVDTCGRVWMIHVWQLEYNDSRVMAFSLLVPGGAITVMKTGQTGTANEFLTDLKTLTDFMVYPYYGTFRHWEEFLKSGEYLPRAFADVRFSFRTGEKVSLRTKRVAVEYTPELFPVSEQSDLSLKFAFFREKDAVVWDICGITMGENKSNNNHVSIFREIRPHPSLKESFQTRWGKIGAQEHPYNGTAYSYEGSTFIHALCPAFRDKQAAPRDYIYTVRVGMEGNVEAPKIEKKLKSAMTVITLSE